MSSMPSALVPECPLGSAHSASVMPPLESRPLSATGVYVEPNVMQLPTLYSTLGQRPRLARLPTGLAAMDTALDGGLPKGRLIEIYGGEGSCKTTFAVHCLAQAQQAGGRVALIEPENSLDPDYAARLGVNLNEVIYGLPENGVAAIKMLGDLIDQNQFDLIVLDSIAALLPTLEDGTFYAATFEHAYMVSQGLRFLNAKLSKASRTCSILFTNQLRFTGGKSASPTGGQAMSFFASLRMEFKKGAQLKSRNQAIGSKISVKVRKSKTSRPYESFDLNWFSDQGLVSPTSNES